MNAKETAEKFLETLKSTYYANGVRSSADFLRGECRMLSLLNLDRSKRYTSGALSQSLGLTTARVASILKTLEKKGYLRRECSAEDKRIVYVSITDEGAEYIEKKREMVSAEFEAVFSRMNEQEREEFIRLLQILTKPQEN